MAMVPKNLNLNLCECGHTYRQHEGVQPCHRNKEGWISTRISRLSTMRPNYCNFNTDKEFCDCKQFKPVEDKK